MELDMKSRRGLLGMVLLIGWAAATHAAAVHAAEPHFVKPADFNFKALLPAPPPPGSAEDAAEMETLLRAQRSRTDAEVARATSESKLSPAAFQSVLGKGFTAKNLPALFALLDDAEADAKPLVTKAKEHFGRLRPQGADSRVHALKKKDDGPSYPSGHSTAATLWMYILCQIAPDKQEALLTRSQEIGWDRVIAGAHYPSDVYGGRVLGKALARAMRADAGYQARLAKAKAEYQAFEKFHGAVDDPAIQDARSYER
jgi:acid phosphatase (class A)